MTVTLPIYIEEVTREGTARHHFTVRPLHFTEPQRKGEQLSRLLARLQSDLQNKLAELSEAPRHDELAQWCAVPVCEGRTLTLRLDWGHGSCQRQFLLAGYEALGRQLWFTPRLPDYHFELLPGQRLAERATECLSRRFREIEKEQGGVYPDDFAMPENCKAALTAIEVKFKITYRGLPPAKSGFSAIFGGSSAKPDGERELRRAGQLLNSLYPDDLPRATGRETEVADLTQWLALPDRRAIVLVGARQVGKSAIIHEWLWRVMDGKSGARKRKVWAVSPMRLISGMSYVGQWEQRVEAICNHLRQSDGVLYLDDLPGLFTAGQSAGSALNVAQLVRPRLEDRAFRLLAETTPDEWRALRERDRGFTDLFQVVPVAEPDDEAALRMLIEVARECEQARHCEFSLEVLPAVIDLHRRFAGDASPFGAAAGFLQRLAVKHGGGECDREGVLREFHERSGLRLPVIDARQVMDRKTIVRDLRKEVAGQDHVLDAFADILLRLKARLNDRGRPLGALLLLGPTGVGKTQCAKALAKHLFGGENRLLRFDMNEMAGASSVRRLTGTPDQPEGLLTAAVRRQPFSVVLFDEIEKAAPEAFDLLLGVLDEGRLSDSLGRVADFTGCVILLTSNLGAREAAAPLGFGAVAGRDASEVYVSAAERFFRPEFFNRLDAVLPFRPLSRDDLDAIVRRLLDEVLARDGLRQRRVLFDCAPEAAERLVDLGFHPQLGARALKRVIEREVAQPLAAQLATRAPGHPLMLHMKHDGAGFQLDTHELRSAPRTVFWPERLGSGAVAPATVVDAAYEALDRLSAAIEGFAPSGAVELTALTAEQARYYHCREQVRRVERLLDAAEARLR
ncbi:MAG: AAA family ATPase [Akkermansiaceae bacterium]|nr:AAA family ATPase [Akkermansiaceae bacterium]